MPKKTDNKLVDDYYYKNDDTEKWELKSKIKPKVTVKRKIRVVKKAPNTPDEETKSDDLLVKKTINKLKVKASKDTESKDVFVSTHNLTNKTTKKATTAKDDIKSSQWDFKKSFDKKINHDDVDADESIHTNKNLNNGNFNRKWSKKFTKPKTSLDDDLKDKKSFRKRNFKSRKTKESEKEEVFFSRSAKIITWKKQDKNFKHIEQNLSDHSWETIIIPDVLSVKELSEKTGVPLIKLIPEFMKNGMKVTINSKIDFETASILFEWFKVNLRKDDSAWFGVEEILSGNIQALLSEDDPESLNRRPPVISIMWHVDHWKTSLLDYIRKTRVVFKEAWWITQSIWAYQVEHSWKKITFIDTPWHEAFAVMRSKWAQSTDIAILVVAADEWVKPQTVESINHAREAWLNIIVAITKMDLPDANIDMVKSGLSQNWLISEDWGWDVPMIPLSSKSWEWVDELIEMILLVSELEEYRVNYDRLAVGTVLESHLDINLWPVSTVLINAGTMQKWDNIVSKWSYWKIKVLRNDIGKNISKAYPSDPVFVVWLDQVTNAWDIVQIVTSSEVARQKALEYNQLIASKESTRETSLWNIMAQIRSWKLKQLKIVLKADSNGSLEAMKWSLYKQSTKDVEINIIHSWVWNVTESDVLMAQSSGGLLVWFNVQTIWNVKSIIDSTKTEYIESKVIYHIVEKIESIISWMYDEKQREVELWEAQVWGIFYDDKNFMILWLKLDKWNKIKNWWLVRIQRDSKHIWTWVIKNLKSWLLDMQELEWPIECGIKLKTDTDVELWDILEVYIIEKS